MKMSTSTKRDGKPKLASGQILDDVMKSVDTWNGEPQGWLRGRIELVERAGPVVKVFVTARPGEHDGLPKDIQQ